MSLLIQIIAASGGGRGSSTPAPAANYGTPPLLFVFAGESNSTGLAPNTSATSGELLARSSVQLLNHVDLNGFWNLEIGVNNETENVQFGDTDPSTGGPYWYSRHGWENQLGNRVEAGSTFGTRNRVFLAKCGQGGTVIADWSTTATYRGINPYSTLIDRVTAAIGLIEALTGQTPLVTLFFSLGINDANAGTNTTTWKADVKTLLGNFRTDLSLPSMQIYYLNFQSITGAPVTNFITKIDEIGGEMSDVHVVDSSPAAGLLLPDGIHWNYAGAKINADNLIDAFLSNNTI